jgi:signal transduction histidine kinase
LPICKERTGMTFFSNLKPKFWDHVDINADSHKYPFNFRRIWKLKALIALGAALAPLMIMAFIDYYISREAMLSEIMLRTSRLTSNTRHTISAFLAERKAVLDFVSHDNTVDYLVAKGHLKNVLISLQKSFGGFIDLGIVDSQGVQLAYTGPYNLTGRNYSRADWFKQVNVKGIYLSDVFFGYHAAPHMVIAVKRKLSGNGFYVLRATLDAACFNKFFSELEVAGEGDAFIINRKGILQTNSRKHGVVQNKINLAIPKFSRHSEVDIITTPDNASIIRGYAYIPETPFILMIITHQSELLALWNRSRMQIIVFIVLSTITVLLLVFGGITFLVNHIYLADQRRLTAMHQAEYTYKMSLIGRLSAGVAHEINNPLAIISEKAGLIKDLFIYKKAYASDSKLMALIDSVLSSVTRCAGITKQLLSFARSSNTCLGTIDLADIIAEVIGFMGKEAEYRSIDINVEIDPNVPLIQSDPGRLHEILLNLISNAFAAMDDGGRLHISVSVLNRKTDQNKIIIKVSDTGHGIPEEDLERVFEPFFCTNIGKGGTGLGLSITYGLVQELDGEITVKSDAGQGATFEVILPITSAKTAVETSTADTCIESIA